MHEFAIAQALVDLAETHVREAHAGRVTRLHCRVGVLQQLDESLLQNAFELVRTGTICDQAELAIQRQSMTASCADCKTTYPVDGWNWTCPRCGREGVISEGGDELELVAIDAEELL